MSFSLVVNYYKKHPLPCILAVALFFRLLSSFFSTGYGMHDDHFLTIEVAQSWIDGENFNGWLPDANRNFTVPTAYSLTYPFILYVILWVCENLGVTDPATKMIFMRLIHALISLLVIYFGF